MNYANNCLFDSLNVLKPKGNYAIGIDISHYQDSIDWQKLKYYNADSIAFVIMKATEGNNYRDYLLSYNWQQANKYQIKKGAYHFYRADRNADSQAMNYLRNVPLHQHDFEPILDFEHTANKTTDSLVKSLQCWLYKVEQYCHKKPIIYTNKVLYKRIIKPYFSQYPLWIAHYDTSHLYNTQWHVWQFTSKGNISGIKRKVDINVMKTNLSEQGNSTSKKE